MGRSPLLLGIDVGSGRCKAAVCDTDGRVLAVARRAMPLHRGAAGKTGEQAVWYMPGELLASVEATAREAVDAADGADRVAAIGVASMAESGVVLDRDGEPHGEIVAWFDPRGAEEARAIESQVGAEPLFAATGLRAAAKQTLPRLARLHRERPETASPDMRWAGVAELVVHAFTGRLVTVPSLAGRTLAFDLRRGDWHPELLALAGWKPEQMPRVVEAGIAAGGLVESRARALGTRPRIAVGVGGHDHVVGAYAAGVVRPGLAADSMGTAEVALVPTAVPVLTPAARAARFSAGRHVHAGTYYLLGALSASGALLHWLVDRLAAPDGGDQSPDGDLEWRLDRRLGSVHPPSGLTAVPSAAFSAHPDAGVSVHGLRERHGPGDILLATLEGSSMMMNDVLDALEEVSGRRIGEVRLFGGGSRVRHWAEIKAAIGRRPVTRLADTDATALGAAWLGGVAAGLTDLDGPPANGIPVASHPELARAYAGPWRERYRRLAGGSPQERGLP